MYYNGETHAFPWGCAIQPQQMRSGTHCFEHVSTNELQVENELHLGPAAQCTLGLNLMKYIYQNMGNDVINGVPEARDWFDRMMSEHGTDTIAGAIAANTSFIQELSAQVVEKLIEETPAPVIDRLVEAIRLKRGKRFEKLET
jgi:hypothetical protein